MFLNFYFFYYVTLSIEMGMVVTVGGGRKFFYIFINVDQWYLTSHMSIAVTCLNKFATGVRFRVRVNPHDCPFLQIQIVMQICVIVQYSIVCCNLFSD